MYAPLFIGHIPSNDLQDITGLGNLIREMTLGGMKAVDLFALAQYKPIRPIPIIGIK